MFVLFLSTSLKEFEGLEWVTALSCEILLYYSVMCEVRSVFDPQAVVCQCGADGVVGDPMDSFNLTPSSLSECVLHLKSWNLPLLLVGGG